LLLDSSALFLTPPLHLHTVPNSSQFPHSC